MFETIQSTIKRYKEEKLQINEENTKMSLVLPFLSKQGYNIFDIQELQSEYVSDMRNNGGEKVDYALLQNKAPVIFIEAKPFGTSLNNYIGQLQRYYVADKEVKYGVLTDGQYYLFFADDERANIMDEKPFYKIDLLCLQDIDLEFLKLFTKESIKDIDNIEQQRGILKLKYFIENSIKRPDKDFIDYISKRTGLEVSVNHVKDLLSSNVDKGVVDSNILKDKVEVKTKDKERLRQPADKPKTFILLGNEYDFVSWRETLYLILNKVIGDKGNLDCVKQQVQNTGNFGILKINEHKYNYKQLDNKEFLYLQLSAKDIKQIIKRVLNSCGKEETDIEYKY